MRAIPSSVKIAADALRGYSAQGGPGAVVYGHLQLETSSGVRSVLVGSRTHITPAGTVIDWRTAPLAGLLFSGDDGDEYELEADGRTFAGTVLSRALLSRDGEDTIVETHAGRFRCRPHDDGKLVALPDDPLVWRRDDDVRTRPRSPLDVALDPEQQRVVDLPAGQAALIIGEAGSGKTTVALLRLARLMQTGARSALIVVPFQGLHTLIDQMLEHLHLDGIDTAMYAKWAPRLAGRRFLGMARVLSEDTSDGTSRLKRHVALRVALDARVAESPQRRTTRADLLGIFGDRDLLTAVVAAADGSLGPSLVSDVIAHTRVQFSQSTEEAFAGMADMTRLQALDGRSIDAGTPLADAGTVDVEDAAVLFELERRRGAAAGDAVDAPASYEVVLLDEAQDLAPLELALIGRSVAPGGTLITSGDADQQLGEASFTSWDDVVDELGAGAADRTSLRTSYRCPPEVMAFARRVRDGHGPKPDGRRFALRQYASECHLVAGLITALGALHTDDRRALTAVICRTASSAERIAAQLSRALDVRLTLDGDFRFRPGIDVTTVSQVKGVEFDHVFVPDLTEASWPDTPEARRALYIACTRVVHQLVLATPASWSPLVALGAG